MNGWNFWLANYEGQRVNIYHCIESHPVAVIINSRSFSIHYKLFFTGWPATNPQKTHLKTAKKHQKTPTKILGFDGGKPVAWKANRSLRNDLPLNYQFGPGTPGKPWRSWSRSIERRGNVNSIPDSHLTKVCSANQQILILTYFPFNFFQNGWVPFSIFCEKSISMTYSCYHWILNIYFPIPVLNRRNR